MPKVRLDELENSELRSFLDGTGGKYLLDVSDEIDRVTSLQSRLCLTGAIPSYWFEREEVLRQSVYDSV